MATILQNLRTSRIGRGRREAPAGEQAVAAGALPTVAPTPAVDIAPNDPLVAYFLDNPGAADLETLHLESPAVLALREAGVKIVVPLVSQGELIGMLNLGPRLSGQDYSTEDRGLLNNLSTQAAPAVRVAQLVQQQQAEARERERVENEMRVARLIQQTLLPKEVPSLPGWNLAAYYQPARAVGGDFYDFIELDSDRLGLVIGDVTDKGVPAALVMATTRAILRSAAKESDSPGQVLERTNDLLHPDIPPKMFVTCLYAVLDSHTGKLTYANAGHDLPYRRLGKEVGELRAIGMPLGLMPGMRYDEKETVLAPGESVLFYSDGIVEAHNAQRRMLGFPQLQELLAENQQQGQALIDALLGELARFTGPGWEQEDDVTIVTLERSMSTTKEVYRDGSAQSKEETTLARISVPSAPGNERIAMDQVAQAVEGLDMPARRLEKLKTAVSEATMNAMEHGNHYEVDKPVDIEVLSAGGEAVVVRITDQGGHDPLKEGEAPDLQAKLAGEQTPRGWGLFLIRNLVDQMRVTGDADHHTVELVMNLGGE